MIPRFLIAYRCCRAARVQRRAALPITLQEKKYVILLLLYAVNRFHLYIYFVLSLPILMHVKYVYYRRLSSDYNITAVVLKYRSGYYIIITIKIIYIIITRCAASTASFR